MDSGTPFSSIKYNDAIAKLQKEFDDRFADFKTHTAKFMEVNGNLDELGQFMRELPISFPEISRMLQRIMCLFGSTYLCEKLFSTINFNKSKFRAKITYEHLQAILRVSVASSLKPNVAELCRKRYKQE
ncbi:EPM2A-interacting protein 1-like [Hyla sarda]|uniref:EPM2A-interacting protein 1-like n=1 Tax=Hyla sarda TaxID=327740 RepID=UPI0024C3722E|nr:EPM2A-interacting protein 1-like [Hyla sarda]